MLAWFAGEFDRCLDLCDRVRPRGAEAISQLALLRARAYLRTSRPADARRAIDEAFLAHGTLDASLTAQMLLGSAEVRLGDVTGGLTRLEAARGAAVDGHPTIRSEIMLNIGLAHYAARDLQRAEAALCEVVPGCDIIYAQALSYLGWIATARGDQDAAAGHFTAAIQNLDSCRRRDRHLEANCLQALSYLAAERFDASVWDLIENRALMLDWAADGLALPRWWITMSAALVHEAAGDICGALRATRQAYETAATPAYRVHALCRRFAIAFAAGDQWLALDVLGAARAIFDEVDPAELRGDEKTVPLVLAEECARAAAETGQADLLDAARHYYGLHRSLGKMESVVAMSADPRAVAYEKMVAAAIAEASGDTALAHRDYGEAWRRFRGVGYTRRAAACAYRLAEITGFDHLYEYVVIQTRATARSYWLRRALTARERLYADPVARDLSAPQREVLTLIAEGLTNAEIARRRDRSIVTVNHTVTELKRAFGVSSRDRLQDVCARLFRQ